MKRYYFIFLAAVMCLGAGCSSEDKGADEGNEFVPIALTLDEADAVSGSMDFALGLYRSVATPGENVTVSPMSATMALAVLANGADGETYEQICNTLGVPGTSIEYINSYLAKITDRFSSIDSHTRCVMANSVWHASYLELQPDFIANLEKSFSPSIQQINPSTFASDINAWTNEHTGGLIKKFPIEVNDGMSLVLANALYFDGKWSQPFKKGETRDEFFYCEDGTTATVPMMNKKLMVERYYENELMSMAMLPFGNGAFELCIILPAGGKSTTELMEACNAQMFKEAFVCADRTMIELYLPRFDIEAKTDLVDGLMQMGMTDAFDSNKANFSKMSDSPLCVGEVKQGCVIRVDEEGAQAAAVTGVEVVVTASGAPKEVTFRVDRPFVYLLRESSTGTILFMGSVNRF